LDYKKNNVSKDRDSNGRGNKKKEGPAEYSELQKALYYSAIWTGIGI
jgi:hypothetical protein